MKSPKGIADKVGQVAEAWEDLAPDKTFGGMTLAQFKARVKPSSDARNTLQQVKNSRLNAQQSRSASDADALVAVDLVVNGIKADSTEGQNSALYEACGYIPKSKRKSGLSRKAKAAATPAKSS
jgi:hypothetical protein